MLLQGAVADADGAQNAQLVVHWDPSGAKTGLTTNVGIPEDRFLKTDTHGNLLRRNSAGLLRCAGGCARFSHLQLR